MERQDDASPPAHRPVPPASRQFTTAELEAVIRRAVELQAGSSARQEEGLSDTDIVRIGQELGLEPATVRRAIAEVSVRAPEEQGAMTALVGTRTVRASRVLRRPAAGTISALDRYLRDAELMVPQRRFTDRTRYVRDSSLAAGMARIARGFARPHKPLNLRELDVAVSALDEESCLVEATVDLTVTRGGLAAGVLGSSGTLAAGWAATVWATPVADPLMLLGLPVLAGAWFGMRAIYGSIFRSTEDRLESLLDRLEHDDLS